jgi:TatD DNase family protein
MIDSHAHLQFPDFNADRSETIARARDAGVEEIVVVGTDPETNESAVALASSCRLAAAVGLHPHGAMTLCSDVIDRIVELAQNDRVVAIGETGLDFYRNLSPANDQSKAFEAQLDVAEQLQLPVIIHCRQAQDELITVLRRRAGRLRGVLHCFSGDETLARFAMESGLYISFAGQITYPRADSLREAVRCIPIESILIETDSPYLPPQKYRGTGRRNEPAYMKETAAVVADLKGMSMAEVDRVTTLNARTLFSLPSSPDTSPAD